MRYTYWEICIVVDAQENKYGPYLWEKGQAPNATEVEIEHTAIMSDPAPKKSTLFSISFVLLPVP